MAESIFQTLHDLATKEGRLVMASAHCPSSATFNLFTHLLLLTADGRLAYHGPCANDEALSYFTGPGLEFSLPQKHFNPADFCLSLVSAAPGADPVAEAARMERLSEAFQASSMRLPEPLPTDNRCVAMPACVCACVCVFFEWVGKEGKDYGRGGWGGGGDPSPYICIKRHVQHTPSPYAC
jgi:hypothetical protein